MKALHKQIKKKTVSLPEERDIAEEKYIEANSPDEEINDPDYPFNEAEELPVKPPHSNLRDDE